MNRPAGVKHGSKTRLPTPLAMDAAAKHRARKVWGLYVHPAATQGERDAAKARLAQMTADHGMTSADFVAACELFKPRVRVKAGRMKRAD